MRPNAASMLVLCIALAVPSTAHAGTTVVLAGDYFGSWSLNQVSGSTFGLGMWGSDPNASAAFTSVELYQEGFTPDGWRLDASYTQLRLIASGSDSLYGTYAGVLSADGGSARSFAITGGSGQFAGAEGSGEVTVVNTLDRSGFIWGPSRITLRGTASIPSAVPEPTTAALLGLGVLPLFIVTRCRRCHRTAR